MSECRTSISLINREYANKEDFLTLATVRSISKEYPLPEDIDKFVSTFLDAFQKQLFSSFFDDLKDVDDALMLTFEAAAFYRYGIGYYKELKIDPDTEHELLDEQITDLRELYKAPQGILVVKLENMELLIDFHLNKNKTATIICFAINNEGLSLLPYLDLPCDGFIKGLPSNHITAMAKLTILSLIRSVYVW